jgi:hypothetical protein
MDSKLDALAEHVADIVEKRLRANPLGVPDVRQRSFYDFKQAALLMNISPRTLMNRHFHKVGPEPTYVGRLVRFSRASLDAYMAAELAKRRPKVPR